MALIRAGLVALALAIPGPAASSEIPDRVTEAVTGWAKARGVGAVQIAVAYRGEVLGQVAQGTDRAPVDIASLSKAVTAVCVADLVGEGVLDWTAPVDRYLTDTPEPLANVILADLAVHDAGLWPDSTQGPMADWRGAGSAVHGAVADSIARRPLVDMTYRYNNENYAVLGAVIEAVTGQPYAQACGARVFAPLGIDSAEPSPLFGRFVAWGGWRIDLGDYARFVWDRFGDSDPADWPATDLGGGASYGLGMVWRSFGEGFNHWHYGALCFADGPNFMTHSVLFANGWGVVTRVEGCPGEDWFFTLDTAIVGAVFRQG